MKIRTGLNILTFVLLALVVYFGRGEIEQAFNLLGKADLWILALLIPVQIISYYATGQIFFSYLRGKGDLKKISHWGMTRMALELNFVNHVLPSGGAAGFSYMTWLLSHYKVSAGRSVMAQIIRFGVSFTTFVGLVFLSAIYLFFDNRINRSTAILSGVAVAVLFIVLFLFAKIVGNKNRLRKFGGKIVGFINRCVRVLTRGKRKEAIKLKNTQKFLDEIHQDYLVIRKDKKILKKPFLWALFANILDGTMFVIAFWSLGFLVNPTLIFIGMGMASVLSIFFFTPGGIGVYETTMVAFLASAGVSAGQAIAGTLLARVILLLGTILSGYIFYQQTIRTYGKR